MKERLPLHTVGSLIAELSVYEKDMLVDFSGLDFYRFKLRSPNLVQCEFNQQVYRTAEGAVVVENLE